ncbi:MAG: bifunctional diaminohydroxyphosphoribosylaminopyrimidine deaminase/5-amino-6-(5-phosphoribosylamino)uracil reductase RibD [Thiobacillaceae bacterium]|nr:bifunctional diaminohydroxyphosphoribosylaminopyrimidine deaminase/5-amino-6-(5-phosphoribosylamino)uracil reductase RibD [Thiobacillaceae bacterium]
MAEPAEPTRGPFSADDHAWMAAALRLAERGLYTTTPNPRVGCVIVKDGRLVGAGWHQQAGGPHAEIHALRQAGAAAHGATVYVTLEPCSHHGRTPPCAEALIDAGVTRVVAAMRDPNPQVAGRGIELLTLAGIRAEVGLMQEEAIALNPGFVSRMTRGRPWVRVKTAASLDGKTALLDGRSQWITGEAARRDGHRWRARACAILTGVGTVLADDPQMNVRHVDTTRQPLKVILDSRLRTPPAARILQGADTLIVCQQADPARLEDLLARGATVLELPGPEGRPDLALLMEVLAQRGVNELHVEAGATVNGALLAAGLIDEWLAYIAPVTLGHAARGLFEGPPLADMSARRQWRVMEINLVGEDLRLILRPV